MTLQETIERKIGTGFDPAHLEVINESHMHNPTSSWSSFRKTSWARAASNATKRSTEHWPRN